MVSFGAFCNQSSSQRCQDAGRFLKVGVDLLASLLLKLNEAHHDAVFCGSNE